MVFIDGYHKEFYEDCLDKTNSRDDPYRKALFYTLGMTEDTRKHINSIYDFKERGICFTGLFQGWCTSTSIRVVRLAFNLYNGFIGDTGGDKNDELEGYTPANLFCDGLMVYFFEAVKLRYPENCM